MNWKDILKAPYVEDISYSSPRVFIDDPNPLPKEQWDNQFLRDYSSASSYGNYSTHKETNTSVEVSSYGRVKKDGKIQRPKQHKNGDIRTLIRGDTKVSHYKYSRNRRNPAGSDDKEKTIAQVPWAVHITLLHKLGYSIPSNAELLGDYGFNTYGEWLKEERKNKGMFKPNLPLSEKPKWVKRKTIEPDALFSGTTATSDRTPKQQKKINERKTLKPVRGKRGKQSR
tara:strand:+ start:529 stop:1209 length:681 start_codon:yes stop_codon:yes gene_type:complete